MVEGLSSTIVLFWYAVETELGKSPTGWFGHSDSPTAADVSHLSFLHYIELSLYPVPLLIYST